MAKKNETKSVPLSLSLGLFSLANVYLKTMIFARSLAHVDVSQKTLSGYFLLGDISTYIQRK